MSVKKCKEIFNQIDTQQRDGLISKMELANFLMVVTPKHLQPVTADDIATYFAASNKDSDKDTLTFEEFYDAFTKMDRKEVPKDKVAEVFSSFDKDNSGFLEAGELELVLMNCKGFTGELLESEMKKIDCSGDKKVSLQEFLDHFYA